MEQEIEDQKDWDSALHSTEKAEWPLFKHKAKRRGAPNIDEPMYAHEALGTAALLCFNVKLT